MEKELTHGLLVPNTVATSGMDSKMAMESGDHTTINFIQATSRTIQSMVKVDTCGLQEISTRATSRLTKEMASASCDGLMEAYMKGSGVKVYSMARVRCVSRTDKLKTAGSKRTYS